MAPTPADAMALAKRSATPSDLICVTGSLMLVGEIKAPFRGCSLHLFVVEMGPDRYPAYTRP